ncbi:MAG: hypothetical protein COA50_16695 [Flavobacteriaceae bacterium]|nr:MAG: hypothetical protein COA50_16695 [Flavobacteriaceae bacterium]
MQKEQGSPFIAVTYGTPEALAKQLDLAIEMLFYLEEDTFHKKEVQDVALYLEGWLGLEGVWSKDKKPQDTILR